MYCGSRTVRVPPPSCAPQGPVNRDFDVKLQNVNPEDVHLDKIFFLHIIDFSLVLFVFRRRLTKEPLGNVQNKKEPLPITIYKQKSSPVHTNLDKSFLFLLILRRVGRGRWYHVLRPSSDFAPDKETQDSSPDQERWDDPRGIPSVVTPQYPRFSFIVKEDPSLNWRKLRPSYFGPFSFVVG